MATGAIGPGLSLRTSQNLVVSPQLQAAIKLLTLGNLELMQEIAAEVEANPLLHLADPDDDGAGSAGAGADSRSDAAADSAVDAGADAGDLGDALQQGDGVLAASGQDVDYIEERFHHDSAADSGRPTGVVDDRGFDRFEAAGPSLAAYLQQQLQGIPAGDRALAYQIIAAIDEAGYLTEDPAAMAARLGVAAAEVERVLALVQQFEPTGVGARNLGECIALQAKERDRLDPLFAGLLARLDLVARGDFQQLKRILGVDEEDLADMLHELRGYDPKPGLALGGARSIPIIPDLFVRKGKEGLVVELNGETLPKLVIDRSYRATIAKNAGHADGHGARAGCAGHTDGHSARLAALAKKERRFLDGCTTRANWLLNTLDQRAATILRVATAIVQAQQAFFEHGVLHLKPLTLRQIAEQVDMHESTVSRVTSNKYLSCARGVFDLKYFFTAAIAAADGADVSAAAVRRRLSLLIEGEDKEKPYSDDRLVELLRADGIEIARRTIAKYREEMGVPSSVKRRRLARLASV